MATLKEKIGYGFGDMASSMFWKVFSAYLPIFYTNVFGLDLSIAALLFLVTKIWDAVSDPMMGIIADRTNTKWGNIVLICSGLPFRLPLQVYCSLPHPSLAKQARTFGHLQHIS